MVTAASRHGDGEGDQSARVQYVVRTRCSHLSGRAARGTCAGQQATGRTASSAAVRFSSTGQRAVERRGSASSPASIARRRSQSTGGGVGIDERKIQTRSWYVGQPGEGASRDIDRIEKPHPGDGHHGGAEILAECIAGTTCSNARTTTWWRLVGIVTFAQLGVAGRECSICRRRRSVG